MRPLLIDWGALDCQLPQYKKPHQERAMFRSIRTAAAVLAALALAGCSDVSGPADPSANPRRNTTPPDATTTSVPDSVTARGLHTIGGG